LAPAKTGEDARPKPAKTAIATKAIADTLDTLLHETMTFLMALRMTFSLSVRDKNNVSEKSAGQSGHILISPDGIPEMHGAIP
jgi:hypothetical protein